MSDQPDDTDSAAEPPHAYRNDQFMNSIAGRPLRIMAEYIEPKTRFDRYNVEDTIVFFGSARMKSREEAEQTLAEARGNGGDVAAAEQALKNSQYYEATRELAKRLTIWSKDLGSKETVTKDDSAKDQGPRGRRFVVCSGAGPGIMEAANRGASEAKGLNIGLGISLPFEATDNPYITRELSLQFHYFFMRKFWFTYLAKAVVIMPGGFGTLDEFFELLTLVQTQKIKKTMPIVLFGTDYWNDVLNFDALARHGTISPSDVNLFLRTDSIDAAFNHITEQLGAYAIDDPGAKL